MTKHSPGLLRVDRVLAPALFLLMATAFSAPVSAMSRDNSISAVEKGASTIKQQILLTSSEQTVPEYSEKRRYLRLLAGILNFYKKYPNAARSDRRKGLGPVYFKLERSGEIVSTEVRRSTGSHILDAELLRIFERIGQFPRFPDGIDEDEIELVVPIHFK